MIRPALIQCQACGRQISTEAPSCPGCGRPTHVGRARPAKIVGAIAAVIVGLGIAWYLVWVIGDIRAGDAHVEHECTMNGFGKGSCAFTNSGTAKGAQCGEILVKNREAQAPLDTVRSARLCSGPLEPKSTVNIDFAIPAVHQFCSGTIGTWQDRCEFTFDTK